MTYITGQPIVFVGTGQTYTDLKALNSKAVVQSLMKWNDSTRHSSALIQKSTILLNGTTNKVTYGKTHFIVLFYYFPLKRFIHNIAQSDYHHLHKLTFQMELSGNLAEQFYCTLPRAAWLLISNVSANKYDITIILILSIQQVWHCEDPRALINKLVGITGCLGGGFVSCF